ncbi:MAG TPA: hypothetical protein VGC59_05915 [Solirubrobacteraceae bacterium]|jgi:uncharacterized membrane protein YeaQ/YmgE (transglycosylase-associated protein family)
MSVIAYIIVLLFIGLVVGALARLALPGKDPMTIPQTIGVGVAGSFIAGLIGALLFGRSAGWLLSIVCAAAIVYFIRRSRGGGLMDPGVPPER